MTNKNQTKSLKILYWNVRSFLQRSHEIQKVLQDVDILICVETWLNSNSTVQFPGFKSLRKDRKHSKGGGILFLIRNGLDFHELTEITSPEPSIEICGVKIDNVHPPLDLIACYRAPGLTHTQEKWQDIVRNVNTNNRSILLGDFNAHHAYWNCQLTDLNGIRLADAIESHNLFLHNVNTHTYIDVHRDYKSNLDLILSSILASDIISVTVCDETWGSDHYPIFVNVDADKHIYSKKTFNIKSKRTNWDKFSEYLAENYDKFLSMEYEDLSPSGKYNFYVDIITNSIKLSTPKKSQASNPGKHKNPVPWWDIECDKIKRLRRAAFKKWQYSKNLCDLITYKKYAASARKIFKSKKKESFAKFAESLNLHTDSTYVWKTCKIFKNRWINTSLQPTYDKTLIKDNKVESLNKISPSWAQTDPSWLPICPNNDFLENPFTFAEFNAALDSKRIKAAPGIDGIDFHILQLLSTKYKLLLVDIFNNMYKSQCFPTSWKQSFVHFIPKSDGKSMRPIALTSCLCKLFETLLKNRLQWWAEVNELFPESQNGFRKGKSCADNLLCLTLKINEAFLEKKNVLAAFLDVNGAFDHVNIEILLTRLASLGCPLPFIQFVKFITHERHIYTELDDTMRLTHKGVPQGGVLSPILYTLYVAAITRDIKKSAFVSQFADDIAVYVKCASIDRGKRILQNAINKIKVNLLELGLELSPGKTSFIHFNNRNILPGSTEIQIDNHSIQSIASTRFLGIIFDFDMSFKTQIATVKKKCFKAMNIIKYLCGTWWGSCPLTLINLYKSYIRPIADYGSYIYLNKKDSIEHIEKIQFAAIRIALGLRISTPTNILIGESKLILLRERAKLLCNHHVIKTLSNFNSPSSLAIKRFFSISKKFNYSKENKILQQCISNLLDSGILSNVICNKNYNPYCFNFNIQNTIIPVNFNLGKTLLKDTTVANSILNDFIKDKNGIDFYTDGSKMAGSTAVGCSCVCPALNIYCSLSIGKHASIYTAECIALYQAFNYALDYRSNNILIFCDSLSVLQSLQSTRNDIKINPYIYEIKKKFIEFSLGNHYKTSIEVIWVPAHCGLQGNEIADTAAKSMTASVTLDIPKIPYTDYIEVFKKNAHMNTEKYIKNLSLIKGKTYFRHYFTSSTKPWFAKTLHLKRDCIVSISRFRADHYSLAASLHRVNIVNDPLCKCGSYSETLNHVIWQCDLYDTQRKNLIINLKKKRFFLPLCIEAIIAKPHIDACLCIINFLKKCNMRI